MSDLPSGRGTFVIKRVFTTDKDGVPLVTKKDIPKVLMIVEVLDKHNRTADVFEHITDGPTVEWKRVMLFKACDKMFLHKESSLWGLEQLQGCSGECMIDVDEYMGNPKCVVKNYYEPKAPATLSQPKVDFSNFDDDIPF